MREHKYNESTLKQLRLLNAGLLSITILGIFQLIGEPPLDHAQSIELYAFTIAIPCLAISIYVISSALNFKLNYLHVYAISMTALGTLSSLIGITAIFWHFSWLVGTLFIITGIVAVAYLQTFRAKKRLGSNP